jgi:DNA-binding CsgD family transcriptional regulator
VASTPQAERWLTHLGPPAPVHPSVVYGLVAHLRALEAAHAPQEVVARTRARLHSGRWLVLHAARLQGTVGQLALVLEPARPSDLAPLLARGYRLSARERAVAGQVLLGHSTSEIGAALGITAYTVRDHLKVIFAKVRVRSRRELCQVLAARTGSLVEN